MIMRMENIHSTKKSKIAIKWNKRQLPLLKNAYQ